MRASKVSCNWRSSMTPKPIAISRDGESLQDESSARELDENNSITQIMWRKHRHGIINILRAVTEVVFNYKIWSLIANCESSFAWLIAWNLKFCDSCLQLLPHRLPLAVVCMYDKLDITIKVCANICRSIHLRFCSFGYYSFASALSRFSYSSKAEWENGKRTTERDRKKNCFIVCKLNVNL